jgi:urease accessory protein
MVWNAQLQLDYALEAGRSVARHRHSGPLRILQSLYPEGDAICHNVLVHPPGGLVGGDTLDMQVTVAQGAHGLVTTPGATRFYRSEGEPAVQHAHLNLAADSRLEWLPQEAICYSGCRAENRLTLALAPGAELIGWDIVALGLPHAGEPFAKGSLHQHLELPGVWLERGTLAADDTKLMDGPTGLAGHKCLATLFLVTGCGMEKTGRSAALDCAREIVAAHTLAPLAGVTSPHPQVIVLRVLAPLVEPAVDLLRQVRSAWRSKQWGLSAENPRIWAM